MWQPRPSPSVIPRYCSTPMAQYNSAESDPLKARSESADGGMSRKNPSAWRMLCLCRGAQHHMDLIHQKN